MAAITYKFGVESQIDELDEAAASMSPAEAEMGGGLVGLGYTPEDLGADFVGEITADVINGTHAGLESMAWLRRVVSEAVAGASFQVLFQGRDVWLTLDEPMAQLPAWNPTTTEQNRVKLLSWTSKMGTPSFSLPAGATIMGGACPGANAGQTLVPVSTLRKAAKGVTKITGRPVRLAQAICQHCYAEGGQYSTGNVQFAQVLRFAWVREALKDGSFAQVMSWAVQNANYYLNGKGKGARGELDGRKYFRIHDSGDFYNADYIAGWKMVAEDNPDVTFWAPSRVWALPDMRKAVNDINGWGHRNLVIRPSAYHVNEPPPRDLGPGWSAGTVVFKDVKKPPGKRVHGADRPYDWDCQAYTTDSDKVTCRDAENPTGGTRKRGCRACWKYGQTTPEGDSRRGLEINYTLH